MGWTGRSSGRANAAGPGGNSYVRLIWVRRSRIGCATGRRAPEHGRDSECRSRNKPDDRCLSTELTSLVDTASPNPDRHPRVPQRKCDSKNGCTDPPQHWSVQRPGVQGRRGAPSAATAGWAASSYVLDAVTETVAGSVMTRRRRKTSITTQPPTSLLGRRESQVMDSRRAACSQRLRTKPHFS
jgi:hypothetical protein